MLSRPNPLPSRRQAMVRCALAAAAPLVCATLLIAAVLAPAPTPVLPLVVLVCVGYPMLVAAELPAAIAVLSATAKSRPRRELLRDLEQLPETQHPLGH